MKFLDDIFGKNALINFSCIRNYAIKKSGKFEDLKEELGKLNEDGFNIYFVVNSGGFKDSEINKINAVFIDLDAGKDLDLSMIDSFKQIKLEEIHNFDFKPSYIIETKNGLHVYWLIEEGVSIEEFRECEELLINYFNADPQVKNPARLMRLPGFYHVKDVNNPFLVKIIEDNNVRYDIKTIIKVLREKSGNDKKKYITIYHSHQNPEALTHKDYSHFDLIKNKDIQTLQDIINPKPVKFNNHDDVYDYIKQQDLKLFLGIDGNKKMFNCIFHDDQKPSAEVLISEDTGHQIYYCFGCGFKGTIIQCVEKIQHANRVDALRFLRQVYKIEYEETEWQKKQKEIIEENMRFIISDEFENSYPETYKLVKRYINDLYLILGYAKDHVLTENFTDDEDNAIFFASIKFLTKICDCGSMQRMNDRIALFTFLGFLNKLQKHQIPDFLLAVNSGFKLTHFQRF
ncbi:CHC2 zinc finger domain-containing protein [Thermosediminibacter oceani]|uniref:CHC2 zinc finger domain-containing protein n=1 Tax=Thermosediminibacter oceani TaxID=291990 RepID=UPI0002E4C7F5|nr:CHC2 zinc finger domain-containing protein [Thermosediminibacter oceani]